MLDRNILHTVILLLFFSLVGFLVGLISERYILCVFAAVLGASALILKKMRLSCPYCGSSVSLSDLLNAKDTPHKCPTCRKKFRVR